MIETDSVDSPIRHFTNNNHLGKGIVKVVQLGLAL